jgi:hypothetical protein
MRKLKRKEYELKKLNVSELQAVAGGVAGSGTGRPAASEGAGLP